MQASCTLPPPPGGCSGFDSRHLLTCPNLCHRIVAGSETTATLLTGTLYLLLKNPVHLERVKDEVRSRFQSEDEITFSSVENLPYSASAYRSFHLKYQLLTDTRHTPPPKKNSDCLFQGSPPPLPPRGRADAPRGAPGRRHHRRAVRGRGHRRQHGAVARQPQRPQL